MSIGFIKKTFISLKHNNFRLFFIGQAISLVGTWLQQTALAWLIYDITGSRFLLGLIVALSALPAIFLSIPGGVIADRYPKRRILLITQSFSMFFAFILGMLVLLHLTEIWHIFIITLCLGIVFAIDMPVRQAFFVDIVSKEDLMNAIALNSSIVNLARVIGPALAGLIMVKFGVAWCFIFNGISFIAVIFALFKLNLPKINIPKRVGSVFKYTIEGFKYAKNNKLIMDLIILMVIIGVFGWSYAILLPVIAKDVFLRGEQGYAMLASFNGLGALIGALFMAYQGNSSKKRDFVNWGVYLFSISIILLAFCKIYLLSLILIAFAGMGLIVYYAASSTLIQSNVTDSLRGRIMGIWALVFGGILPIGSLFSGTMAQYFGISKTLLISAIICFVFTAILSLYRSK